MRHFYRTHLPTDRVLDEADRFFPAIGLAQNTVSRRVRTYAGPLGTLRLDVKPEGGHYIFVDAETDQMGESRLDRNVKKFFVELHRADDPSHTLEASY